MISNTLNNNTNQSVLFRDINNNSEFLKNLEKIKDWPLVKKLQFELEVIGFYFLEHPLSLYSEKIFNLLDVSSYNKIKNDSNKKKI